MVRSFVKIYFMFLAGAVFYGNSSAALESAPPVDKPQKSAIQRIIFEEQRIEGKIRRPQLVLIKADQRPEFTPMMIQGFSRGANIIDFIDESVLDRSPVNGPFKFDDTKIRNYTP